MKQLPNRKTTRLKGYDYSSPGYYFVTNCTQDRIHRFGKIIDGEMHLNDAGKMVQSVWNGLPKRFQMISLDAFQIMPNHIHSIIVINNAGGRPEGRTVTRPVRTGDCGDAGDFGIGGAKDCGDAVGSEGLFDESKKKTLGEIVGAFASIITNRYIKGVKMGLAPPFHKRLLQHRYYDHIIRNEDELFRIRQYIKNNPANWQRDKMKNPDKNGVREISIPYGEEPWMV